MTSPPPGQSSPSTLGRGKRILLWVVVFGALIIGVALAFIYGARVTPFLDAAP